MIEQLKALGLTENEAKSYLCLYEKPDQSGYEVAKTIGVSRSNVYASLSSLRQKGIVNCYEDKTTTYTAVDIEEVLALLQLKFKQSANILKSGLKDKKRDEYRVYSILGKEEVMAMIERTIAHSQKKIIADIWPQDFIFFLPLLEEAQDRGVNVILNTFEVPKTTLTNILIDDQGIYDDVISDFSLICDDKKAVLGSFDETMIPSALETHHPAMIRTLQNAFEHDLIIEVLNREFKDIITKKYPAGFNDILKQKYKK